MSEDVKNQMQNERMSNSNVFFSSGFVNRCYFTCSDAIFFYETLKRSSCFVKNCELQQVQMFRRR